MIKTKAYPTKYKGIQFRSRLEAKWAWMFDQFKWPWEYEPFELDGYIPDFVIPFAELGDVLVEIKPGLRHDVENYSDAIKKIERSGWERERVCEEEEHSLGHTVILGASVYKKDYDYRFFRNQYICGIQFDHFWSHELWNDCTVVRCFNCRRVFFYALHGERRCRWCGDGGKHYSNAPVDLHSYWAGAKNHFQWRKG